MTVKLTIVADNTEDLRYQVDILANGKSPTSGITGTSPAAKPPAGHSLREYSLDEILDFVQKVLPEGMEVVVQAKAETAPKAATTKKKKRGRPRKNAETSKPEPENDTPPTDGEQQEDADGEQQDEEADGEQNADTTEADREKALSVLMEVFAKSDEHAAQVQELTKKYGVKKFSQIPAEKASDLLRDALELQGKANA